MSLAEKYRKSKDLKWSMKFSTHHPDGDSYYGIVSHIAKNFIVVMKHDEFVFNGTLVLPKKVIKACRDRNYDTCANAVLRHSGNIRQFKPQRWLDRCQTLKEVLEKLKQKDIWPVVEIMYITGRKTKTAFYIGKITRIEKDAFWIFDYGADGQWQKEWEIKYREVFKVEFDDSYTRYFNAYMKDRLPEELSR
jgi:hypothetical protein